MNTSWPLQDAKNQLSRLVAQSETDGPQTITVRGREKAVVLSIEEYRRLVQPTVPLSEFFRASPLYGEDLDLDRGADPGREITL
ncbi:MAG TPA: type II toxin-antitoxin system Phd/YefM family antitoxin [Chloroflexota bacterium]|jgi:prevent-host-death family protein